MDYDMDATSDVVTTDTVEILSMKSIETIRYSKKETSK